MKRTFLLLLVCCTLSACSSVKQSQRALNRGDYNTAISIALDKLQKDKSRNSHQGYILILEDAFKKVTAEYNKRIAFMKKEGNPGNTREIFLLYDNLNNIQNQITPLLPLYIEKSNRNAFFHFRDYTDYLIDSKQDLAEFLYQEARTLMENRDKLSFRLAYGKLSELQRLSLNYKDSRELMEEAHFSGTDYVLVEVKNQTQQIIPDRLEQDLLNFNTYGLDDFWTKYHASRGEAFRYDFGVALDFLKIKISPERIMETEIPLKARIHDGYSYKKDAEGNIQLDSLGNKIKIEHFATVQGTLYRTIQTKVLSVQSNVDYLDLNRNLLINSYPMATEFVFENAFATFRGDERVLSKEEKKLLENRFRPFPTNEQMLLDVSSDLKGRLGLILKEHPLR